VDKITGVELRRDELDSAGGTLSLAIFTSVHFPSHISDSEVTPRYPRNARLVQITQSGVYSDVEAVGRAAGFAVRPPLITPSGFHFVAGTAGTIAGRRSAFMRFTDGLSDITIIEAPVLRRGSQPSRALRVLPRPYGEVEVNYALDDLEVVILGRGDPRDLLAMAESLEPSHEKEWRRGVSRAFNGRSRLITTLRNKGMSGDTVVALLTLLSHTNRSEQEILRAYQDSWCWREVAKRLRVSEVIVARQIEALCSTP